MPAARPRAKPRVAVLCPAPAGTLVYGRGGGQGAVPAALAWVPNLA